MKKWLALIVLSSCLYGCSYGVAAGGGNGSFGMAVGTGLRF